MDTSYENKGIFSIILYMLPLSTWVVPLIILRNMKKFTILYILTIIVLNLLIIPSSIKYTFPKNGFIKDTWLSPIKN